MNNIIRLDLYRYGGKKQILKGFKHEGFVYTFFFRKASKFKKRSLLGIFYRIILKRYSYKYGFQIPPGTQIGEGLFIGHFGLVVINNRAKIGSNCNISHGVTIGQTNRGKLKGYPTIGNRVWIGTGAVIVGNINIGDNVLIAPNTYVNIDIPPNSIVFGSPAKIIFNKDATSGYINFTV